MTTTILTDAEIFGIFDTCSDLPLHYDPDEIYALGRAIEQAVLQSPEIQTLRDLLKEARQQLPLAAQFWNEDDESERGSRNVRHVMELIARVDAAMEKQP